MNVIYRQVLLWAKNATLDPDPEMPQELRNRPRDNWLVLVSCGDSFGPAWGAAARDAAITFRRGYYDEDVGVTLLGDVRSIFDATRSDRIASEQLVALLCDMDEAGWSEWRGLKDDQQPRRLRGTVGANPQPSAFDRDPSGRFDGRVAANPARGFSAVNSRRRGVATVRKTAQRHNEATSSNCVLDDRENRRERCFTSAQIDTVKYGSVQSLACKTLCWRDRLR